MRRTTTKKMRWYGRKTKDVCVLSNVHDEWRSQWQVAFSQCVRVIFYFHLRLFTFRDFCYPVAAYIVEMVLSACERQFFSFRIKTISFFFFSEEKSSKKNNRTELKVEIEMLLCLFSLFSFHSLHIVKLFVAVVVVVIWSRLYFST